MDSILKDEMSQETLLLRRLSENYDSLYLVDFDKNTIKPYRMSKVIADNFGEYFNTCPSYEDAMTKYINIVVSPADKEAMLRRAKPEFIKEKLRERSTYSYDFRVDRGGNQLYFRFKISNLRDEPEVHQAAVGFTDVTPEAERINQLLESKAMLDILEYDNLTGLYTKEFFFKKVSQYISEHPEEDLLFWTSDIQGLKIINEKYGMEKGNEVLKLMASQGKCFPGFLFGGRIEGDKFSALMVDSHNDLEKLNKYFDTNATKDYPVPNVIIKHGVYRINRKDNHTIQGMYDRSILALLSIKDKFECYIGEYNEKLKNDLLVSRQITEDARKALPENQFKVYYQPKIDISNGEANGAEALVRWIHPELGFMNPGIFIPIFEQNGFITKLDFYIWEEVCKSLKKWKEDGVPPVIVSVNVSRRDFEVPFLAEKIIELVDKYGIEHKYFQVEITESSYSDNPTVIKETIKMLHDSGFTIALDDFGTGYSSMMALSNLDLDIMKLDMSIIQNDIPGTEKNILEFSMQLAKMMNLKTVAEGVETKAQESRIRSLGGDYIQGYYYSKPLPEQDFVKYIIEK